jgi:hypothetical protein
MDDAKRFFRLDRVAGRRELPAGFAIVTAASGQSHLSSENGWSGALPRQHDARAVRRRAPASRTDGSLLVARPPAAS